MCLKRIGFLSLLPGGIMLGETKISWRPRSLQPSGFLLGSRVR